MSSPHLSFPRRMCALLSYRISNAGLDAGSSLRRTPPAALHQSRLRGYQGWAAVRTLTKMVAVTSLDLINEADGYVSKQAISLMLALTTQLSV